MQAPIKRQSNETRKNKTADEVFSDSKDAKRESSSLLQFKCQELYHSGFKTALYNKASLTAHFVTFKIRKHLFL